MIHTMGIESTSPMTTMITPANNNMTWSYPTHVDRITDICHYVSMAVITIGDIDTDLEAARAFTRSLAYGEIVGAVFPIRVGEDAKAWYKVISLRPLRVQWMPFTSYQVEPEALSGLSKTSIYRLIEADI